MRLKFIFFKVLQTVIGETLGTIFSSTIFSANSRTVHRFRPSGASEQARASKFDASPLKRKNQIPTILYGKSNFNHKNRFQSFAQDQ